MNKWHSFVFRVVWPDDQDSPQLWVDVLLMDTIVRQLLSRYRADLTLWQLHRRAERDPAGHEFALRVYTTEQTAHNMDMSLTASPDLASIAKAGLLEEYRHQPHPDDKAAEVRSISDQRWPVQLQIAWPQFVMGVSETLMEMVQQLKNGENAPTWNEGSEPLKACYVELHERLSSIWQSQASNAFLHHLNALFGYVPFVARPRTVHGVLATF